MKVALPWSPNQSAPPATGVRAARRRKRSAWVPLLALVVVGAAVAAGVYYWRAQQATAATPQTLPVPVIKGDLSVNVESSGQVEPNRSFAVPLQTAGQVREVLAVSHEATQLVTIEVRHQRVRNNDVNTRTQQKLHRFQTVTGGNHLISRTLQHHFQIPSQRRIVFDQKHTLSAFRRIHQWRR